MTHSGQPNGWVRWAPIFLPLILTLGSLLLLPKISLSTDLTRLFPNDVPSRALADWVHIFGGNDITMVMVRASDREATGVAAHQLAEALQHSGVGQVTTHIGTSTQPGTTGDSTEDPVLDPTLFWAFADTETQLKLARAIGPDLRQRLADTRTLLLSPGSGALVASLRHDPLRLSSLVFHNTTRIASTVGVDPSGELTSDEGRVRFVLLQAPGSALSGPEARKLVNLVTEVLIPLRKAYPLVRFDLVGGAAVARDTEQLVKRDLVSSSVLGSILVSLAFLATFRRPRALLAIFPPLLFGTLWTTSAAAFMPGGLSAVALGFSSVVLGVGLDTGVHVYAAVLAARANQPAAAPSDIAAAARKETWRPTLGAAVAASLAFLSLTLSQLTSLRQLGILCALGEVLTAGAILLVTPELGARLERRPIHVGPNALGRLAVWFTGRIKTAVIATVAVVALFVVVGAPRPSDAVVAIRPTHLPALQAQEEASRLVSGVARQTQVLVLQRDTDRERLLARGEAILAGLGAPNRDIDALANFLPSQSKIVASLHTRDSLNLPAVARELTTALEEIGLSPDGFAPASNHLLSPATLENALKALDVLERGPLALIVNRHLRPSDGVYVLTTYVRGSSLNIQELSEQLRQLDSDAVLTGFPILERSLQQALREDLPRTSLAALLLVGLSLRAVLGRARAMFVVLAAVLFELLLGGVILRVLGTPLHIYNALVLPVLIGITVDESTFLVTSLSEGPKSVERQGRSIAATACTTAAGFAGLLICDFPGLRDLGVMGLVGSLVGLVATVMIVPALSK